MTKQEKFSLDVVDSAYDIESLVVVKQLPLIEEKLEKAAAQIDARLSGIKDLACTEDTKAAVKKLRAELGKEFDALESVRKKIKKAVVEPYESFEAKYKSFVSEKYKSADASLKEKIDAVEGEIKRVKREELKSFFDECAEAKAVVDYASFERAFPTIGLSESLASLKKRAAEYIDDTASDIESISALDDAAELLVEYKASHNLAFALSTVRQRKEEKARQEQLKAEREERAKLEAEQVVKVEQYAPPEEIAPRVEAVEEPVKKFTARFAVTDTQQRLEELKAFLIAGGYLYQNI